MENTVICCQECVFIGPLPTSGCRFIVESICFGNVFTEPLPSNGHMHHNIYLLCHCELWPHVVVPCPRIFHTHIKPLKISGKLLQLSASLLKLEQKVFKENNFYACATFFAHINRLHQCIIWMFSLPWLWTVLSLLCLRPGSCWFLASPILCPWRWRRRLQKHRLLFNGLHGFVFQKVELFKLHKILKRQILLW
jgi:hypothetical protein